MNPKSSTPNLGDAFANIAGTHRHIHEELVEPQPPKLNGHPLNTDHPDPRAAFRPTVKLDTAKKLEAALIRERKRHAKFLRNLAPPASARQTFFLEKFDWRLETETDGQNFADVLSGAGDWKRICIPHYGGPLGKKTALYRTTFRLPSKIRKAESYFICFRGVDYKAHVFVNGAYLGSHEGFFAPFEFDFTAVAKRGENVLLVKVENDATPISGRDLNVWGMDDDGDKLYAASGPGWDEPGTGWHACPPGMGIYQPVYIEARPALHLSDVFVRPLLEQKQAEIWIEIANHTQQTQKVSLSVSIFGQNFRSTVFRNRTFQPAQEAGRPLSLFRFLVDIPHPRCWEPNTPWLYQIQVALANGDMMTRQFGMRSFRMDVESSPKGRMFLNGREIRLRGANTMGAEQQAVMQGDMDRLRDDILLTKLCNMNFWRLTQRPVQTEIYHLCDQLGLMTQTDLPLFGYLPRRQFCEAIRQAEEMERLVRGHACNIMISYMNEPFPAPGDRTHRHCTKSELLMFYRAADEAVRLANPDRVIKPVDGDYVPPSPGLPDNHCYCCWYTGHGLDIGKLHKGFWQRVKSGWFYGCGEFGAEGLDSEELMRKYYPASWLPQPSEKEWSPSRIKAAQTGKFHYFFFDTQHSIADWIKASQEHQAWATRIMTEAFRRDNRMHTFAIHLLIDAFPAGWMKTIMDAERQPKPAFFAYREALTPLMVNIRTDRFAWFSGEKMNLECWVCNDTHKAPKDMLLRYQLEIDGKVIFSQQTSAHIETHRASFQGLFQYVTPEVSMRTHATFRLGLALPGGKILHDTAVAMEFFPKPHKIKSENATVIGHRTGKAMRLARQLDLKPGHASNLFLIDNMEAFQLKRQAIESAVFQGATAIFLEIPQGVYKIGKTLVKVRTCGMGPRHFVSRQTDHPLVASFKPQDFRLWHDPEKDRIAPLLTTTFEAKGWSPILQSGDGGAWGGEWKPALAAAIKHHGQGSFLVCQITLADRVKTNPVALQFAQNLVQSCRA